MSALLLNTSFTAADLGQRAPSPPGNGNADSDAPDLLGGSSTPPNAARPHDLVTLSPEAQQAGNDQDGEAESPKNAGAPKGRDGEPLGEEEQKQVEELEARDREVRQHEQAHKAAAGAYATSGPTYSYQEGPDGKRYAVGGSVGIDVSPEATPEETIAKMQVVRRAALAPAEPSGQDRKVAAQAARTEQAARAELAEQNTDPTQDASQDESAEDGAASPAATAGGTLGKLEAFKPPSLSTFDAVA